MGRVIQLKKLLTSETRRTWIQRIDGPQLKGTVHVLSRDALLLGQPVAIVMASSRSQQNKQELVTQDAGQMKILFQLEELSWTFQTMENACGPTLEQQIYHMTTWHFRKAMRKRCKYVRRERTFRRISWPIEHRQCIPTDIRSKTWQIGTPLQSTQLSTIQCKNRKG